MRAEGVMRKVLPCFFVVYFLLLSFSCTKKEEAGTEHSMSGNTESGNSSSEGKKEAEHSFAEHSVSDGKPQEETADFEKCGIILNFDSANKEAEIEVITKDSSAAKIIGAEPKRIYGNGEPLKIISTGEKIGFEGEIVSLKIQNCKALNSVHFVSAPQLNYFSCRFTNISNADFSGCPELSEADLSGNARLTEIKTDTLPLLESLNIENSGIAKIDLSKNTGLKKLVCGGTNLNSLNLNSNKKLEVLDVSSLNLKKINLKNNTELLELNCSSNSLTVLDLSANEKIIMLNCRNNAVTDLALFQNKNIEFLDCGKNKLEKLFLESNSALKTLFCDGNKLFRLDLSENKNIENVYCFNNELEEIKVNKGSPMKTLFCFNNKLGEKAAETLADSLPPGDGYDTHTLVWYAEKNPDMNYDSEKYRDGNIMPSKEQIEKLYGGYWYFYTTVYGLEDINDILNSLKQKN